MKNQYFADVNDYRKYGLLRGLASPNLGVAVCWMLTADDGSADRKRTGYLRAPRRFRALDADLFDLMSSAVERRCREVRLFEESSLLAGAMYHRSFLTDDPDTRAAYFDALWRDVAGYDIVFFDPDNGIEVKTVKKGRPRSCKYLYWDEIAGTYARGHSVAVLQFFPRVQRAPFIQGVAAELERRTSCGDVVAVRAGSVAYFVASQPRHADALRVRIRRTVERWHPQLELYDA